MSNTKKVIQKHEECIGCGSCAIVCPKFWEMNDDEMKAYPKNGKKNAEGNFGFEIEEKDLECNKEAADVCPVSVIKITDN